jgi:hypothetical protein
MDRGTLSETWYSSFAVTPVISPMPWDKMMTEARNNRARMRYLWRRPGSASIWEKSVMVFDTR